MYTHCLRLPSVYRDSVVLMQLSHSLEALPDIQQAAVMMGAPQNKTLLRQAGLLTPEGEHADATDLLICIQARSPAAAEQAIQQAQQHLLHQQAAVLTGETAPRTLETALRRLPDANLACISVPGPYAPHEARKAIAQGLHVFLFSDHVELDIEADLKQQAAQQGVLVMGPDCGTSILNGVPLGFANHVPRGPIGLVSASGTGLQHVTCLLARQGIGISQAIGVGGRDLHRQIGGRSMHVALQALAGDPETRVIVLISKPPEVTVAARLEAQARQAGKPCVLAFLGDQASPDPGPSLYRVPTLEEAALVAAALIRREPLAAASPDLPPHLLSALETARAMLQPGQRAIRALYGGGTLAYEALWLLRRTLGAVSSNLDDTLSAAGARGHVVLDLGAETYTQGRPHPMLDPTARRQQLLALAQQSEVAVVVCDVILGWGAHADPAGALAAAWQETAARARVDGRHLVGVATVCGTPTDVQGYDQQCEVLRAAGFILADSNAQAVRLAAAMVDGQTPPGRGHGVPTSPGAWIDAPFQGETLRHLAALFATGPRVINLGLEQFADQIAACGAPVVHVDWRPPAGGNTRLSNLLERLR